MQVGLLDRVFLLTALPGLLAAQLPDDAAPAEFAVETGVGAGPAPVQALLAIGDLHFLAEDAGVPVRVVAACIPKFHVQSIAKVRPRNQGEPERLRLGPTSHANDHFLMSTTEDEK